MVDDASMEDVGSDGVLSEGIGGEVDCSGFGGGLEVEDGDVEAGRKWCYVLRFRHFVQ